MADTSTEYTLAAAGRSISHSAEAQGVEHPHKGGLPQFEFEYWGGQIVWLAVIFVLLYVLFARVFIPRIRKVTDERASTIAGAIASARSVQAEADAQAEAARLALDEARAHVHRTAAEAKAKSLADSKARQGALETELNAKLAEAEARIRASRDSAMSGVAAVARDTAQAIVEKLTGLAPAAAEISAVSGSEG
jgi:F-type H+-transporting ATPase subunit b